MKIKIIVSAFTLILLTAGVLFAQKAAYRVSEPLTYKNLTIFLIHGKGQSTKGNILTLQEAMERDILIVYETSDVNSLSVEISRRITTYLYSQAISSRAESRTGYWP